MEEFEQFLAAFSADPDSLRFDPEGEQQIERLPSETCKRFIRGVARSSYNNRLLRFLLPTTSPSIVTWNDPAGWKASWPNLSKFFTVFACDWQGNQIGFDSRVVEDGEPAVGMLEPGTGKLLRIAPGFTAFLRDELIKNRNALLCDDVYRRWLMGGGVEPAPNGCVGYRIPLFQAGEDSFANMQQTDMDVYLSLTGQLRFPAP